MDQQEFDELAQRVNELEDQHAALEVVINLTLLGISLEQRRKLADLIERALLAPEAADIRLFDHPTTKARIVAHLALLRRNEFPS